MTTESEEDYPREKGRGREVQWKKGRQWEKGEFKGDKNKLSIVLSWLFIFFMHSELFSEMQCDRI